MNLKSSLKIKIREFVHKHQGELYIFGSQEDPVIKFRKQDVIYKIKLDDKSVVKVILTQCPVSEGWEIHTGSYKLDEEHRCIGFNFILTNFSSGKICTTHVDYLLDTKKTFGGSLIFKSDIIDAIAGHKHSKKVYGDNIGINKKCYIRLNTLDEMMDRFCTNLIRFDVFLAKMPYSKWFGEIKTLIDIELEEMPPEKAQYLIKLFNEGYTPPRAVCLLSNEKNYTSYYPYSE